MSYHLRAFSVVPWLAGLVVVAIVSQAQAEEAEPRPVASGAQLYQRDETSGLALTGFDPVSYFLPEGPQAGQAGNEVNWRGVAWRFASAANRAAFEESPSAYAPRIGGYDAGAVSLGRIVDANPWIYLVTDGRLYLFRNDANRARFLADPSLVGRSEERWASLRTDLVGR